MSGALAGRCAIVTGASRGLGLEIARKYVAAGASVAICARGAEALLEARLELLQLAGPGQAVVALTCDISRAADVSELVERSLAELGRLDILVNNAAVTGPAGPAESVDWNEWLRTLEINFLGAVLLCRAVLPHFKTRGYGKIVQLSGGGATNPLPMLSAYAASKAAVIRFMETLALEARPYGVDVNAIAPGALNTRMLEDFIAAGPERIGQAFHERSLQQQKDGGVPLEKGAALAVFLGSAASDGISGKLLSAVWDPWETLAARIGDLRATDVYTLRRIVPQDRDLTWGHDK